MSIFADTKLYIISDLFTIKSDNTIIIKHIETKTRTRTTFEGITPQISLCLLCVLFIGEVQNLLNIAEFSARVRQMMVGW